MDDKTNISPSLYSLLERILTLPWNLAQAGNQKVRVSQVYWDGFLNYLHDFMVPFWIALRSFNSLETNKLRQHPPGESIQDYLELLQFNLQVAEKGAESTLKAMNSFHAKQGRQAFSALTNTLFDIAEEDINQHLSRQTRLLEQVVYAYPKAIKEIGSEFGFHFEEAGYKKTAETDRFFLYQVLPNKAGVKTRENGKPIIIIHPYVLGPNILCFLPREGKSYVHCFANQGLPTYVRILKPIEVTPAVQTMTGEDDALDTRFFCEKLRALHGKPVTLNGFCQGGFVAVADILSGELDGLVDALITCVAPMDGTRSKSLVEYMEHLPPRFRDLGYAVKTLPSGNQVVDGKVMSWVYKLKSMEKEAPVYSFYQNLMMFDRPEGQEITVNKTAAALNHWLIYDRSDLPVSITRMSFDSYTIPVDREGNLPIKLFNRPLNFKRLKEKEIPFLICYADKDDLVEKESALAPLDYIEAEVTVFPKGHGAIATSWSYPDSECSLDSCFGKNYRGPVRFQLDLEQALTPRP
jgi:hypothetical protein